MKRNYVTVTLCIRTFIEPVGDAVENELWVSGERELHSGLVRITLAVNVVAIRKYLQCCNVRSCKLILDSFVDS